MAFMAMGAIPRLVRFWFSSWCSLADISSSSEDEDSVSSSLGSGLGAKEAAALGVGISLEVCPAVGFDSHGRTCKVSRPVSGLVSFSKQLI